LTDAREMNVRLEVLRLVHDESAGRWSWETWYKAWAAAEADARPNLFSSIGIGTRGVTFTMWRNPRLTLTQAIRWNGQFCFLTSVIPTDRLYCTVQAAIVNPVTCRMDVEQGETGDQFPGVLTEKYLGHEQRDPMAVSTSTLVLVVPKEITLAVGSLVRCDTKVYEVQIAHELDEWKNEYEITREADV